MPHDLLMCFSSQQSVIRIYFCSCVQAKSRSEFLRLCSDFRLEQRIELVFPDFRLADCLLGSPSSLLSERLLKREGSVKMELKKITMHA